MNKTRKFSSLVVSLLAAIAFIAIASTTQAAVATFSNILDGNGDSSLFDTTATGADPTDGNILNIGLNDFRAEFGTISALDTLSFMITAPDGYFINALTYTESGSGLTASDGVAIATGSIVVNNVPVNFLSQVFGPNSGSAWSISPILPASIFNNQPSVVAVSIVNSLFAVGSDDNTWIEKDSAALTVNLASVPVPSSLFLLGSGLFAITFRMRRKD